ncbi:MAG: hypothetical protein A2Y62_10180 [Candidatus Fischerbacteria bacterium RBG_13_37_8]|uniref:Cobalt ABC transporter permease n=1 Tax=Candidatus Fischerbacteria bacterium RBG_13_37_8 TaxID=1817863 RepID=A0A1F5V5X9_9BACT|nr:MAG: hypothetical protein A2Y62_10180 [Candidatus Fischerbacteria bacterium RBG_13_37_8]
MYISECTYLHNAHPSSKIFSLLGLFFIVLISQNFYIISSVLVLLAGIGISAKLWSNLKKSLLFSAVIIIFSSVMWIFFYPRSNVIKEAFIYGFVMGLRLVLVFIAGVIFLSTTRIEEFIYGLRRYHLPYKLCFAISLAFRLIPLIYETAQIVIDSQRIKGIDLKQGTFKERIYKYGPLLTPIISYILREANYITLAVESRGFSYSVKKTDFLSFKVTYIDGLIYLFPAVIIIVVLFW